MSRFLFHLRRRQGIVVDAEGSDYENVDAAVRACLHISRDLIAEDVRQGMIDLDQWIVLTDGRGQVIREIPFALALGFQHPEDSGEAARCPGLSPWTRVERQRPASAEPAPDEAGSQQASETGACATSV